MHKTTNSDKHLILCWRNTHLSGRGISACLPSKGHLWIALFKDVWLENSLGIEREFFPLWDRERFVYKNKRNLEIYVCLSVCLSLFPSRSKGRLIHSHDLRSASLDPSPMTWTYYARSVHLSPPPQCHQETWKQEKPMSTFHVSYYAMSNNHSTSIWVYYVFAEPVLERAGVNQMEACCSGAALANNSPHQ